MASLRFAILGFFFVCMGMVGPVQAELVNEDWLVRGDKLLTRDTETGLEWLNVKQTYRRSRAEVTQLFGVGQEFEGFRFATLDEYQTLMRNAGIPLTFDRAQPTNNFFAGEMKNAKPALKVTDLMGYSIFMFRRGAPDDGHRRLHGILDDGFSPILETFQPTDPVTGKNIGGLRARLSAAVLEDHQVGVDVGMLLVRVALVSSLPKPVSPTVLAYTATAIGGNPR